MTIDGVFIRLGATVQHATRETIKEMIVESLGILFKKNISINQDLTFTYANQLFKKKKISFGDIEKKNLGLINSDNKYTNLEISGDFVIISKDSESDYYNKYLF